MSDTRDAREPAEEPVEVAEAPQATPQDQNRDVDDEAGVEAATEVPAARLEEAERRAQLAEERALRLQAEMDNLRKRTEREVENAHKFGVERLLTELLPVIDSMELGLGAADGEKAGPDSLREGMELTLKMLRGATEKFGIAVVDPVGQPFNPEFQQAISMQPGTGAASNTVLTVVQKGYTLNGRLVRPAMVVVAA